MNPRGTHRAPATSRLAAIASAAVLAMGATAATAQAVDAATSNAAVARALAHVKAFPGRTLDGAGQSYASRDVLVDADGTEHVRLERLYRGLPVLGGDLVVHTSRAGTFLEATRTLRHSLLLGTTPRLTAAQALAAAQAARAGAPEGQRPKLVVYARGERPALAWDVRLYSDAEDETPSELHVIVDALSGTVLESWDDIHTAPATGTGKTFFDGNVTLTTDLVGTTYNLRDPSRGSQYTVDMNNIGFGKGKIFTDADNTWGNNALTDRATVGADAQYGTAVTWDYYKNVHGRTGIANDGKGAYNRVHYKKNYANAFWSDSCFCMTYGDGNASFYPLVSLDVAGHEMTHGVTSRTAALVYSGESGGLNEGTSDIFGSMVEFYANNPNDPGDYLIGEELVKAGGSLRSMIKPSSDGSSADCWYSTVGNLDVHYSSGVANHFYYLLAQGTTGGSPSPTCATGNTRVGTGTGTLAGIGRSKAEKIWYRALTVYMTSSTDYHAARTATLSAASDLYGAGSPEVNAVSATWSAVLVN